ncbi:hypothetical protein, partial [Roseateles sp. BYS96W]
KGVSMQKPPPPADDHRERQTGVNTLRVAFRPLNLWNTLPRRQTPVAPNETEAWKDTEIDVRRTVL